MDSLLNEDSSSTLDNTNGVYMTSLDTPVYQENGDDEMNPSMTYNEYNPNLDQRCLSSLCDMENNFDNSRIYHIPAIDGSVAMPQSLVMYKDNEATYSASMSNPNVINFSPHDSILDTAGAQTDPNFQNFEIEKYSPRNFSNKYSSEMVQHQGNDVILSQNWSPSSQSIPSTSRSREAASSHNLEKNSSTSKSNMNTPHLVFRTWEGEKFYLPAPGHNMIPSQNHHLVSQDTSQRLRSNPEILQNQVPNSSPTLTVPPSQRCIESTGQKGRLLAGQNTSSVPKIQNKGPKAIQHQVSYLDVDFSKTLLVTYVMFLHAHECDQPFCSSVEGISPGNLNSYCYAAKGILDHADNCNEESRCPLTDCKRFKQFQNHFKVCVDARCSVCRYLKIHFDLSRQMRVCVRNDCSFCWTLIQLNENSSESLAHPHSPAYFHQNTGSPDRRHSIGTSSESSTSTPTFHSDHHPQQASCPSQDDNFSAPNRRYSVGSSDNSVIRNTECSPPVSKMQSASHIPEIRPLHESTSLGIEQPNNSSSSSSISYPPYQTSFSADVEDLNDTEAQLSSLVHSMKCRKLAGECNNSGCGERKKSLFHLFACKGKNCADGNCKSDFFHSVLTRHRQSCITGCSHCNFFKGRLGNHPFHINEQHKPQNVNSTISNRGLEENTSASRPESLAPGSNCSTITTPSYRPASQMPPTSSGENIPMFSQESTLLIGEKDLETLNSYKNSTSSTDLAEITSSFNQGQHVPATRSHTRNLNPSDRPASQMPPISSGENIPIYSLESTALVIREEDLQTLNSSINSNSSTGLAEITSSFNQGQHIPVTRSHTRNLSPSDRPASQMPPISSGENIPIYSLESTALLIREEDFQTLNSSINSTSSTGLAEITSSFNQGQHVPATRSHTRNLSPSDLPRAQVSSIIGAADHSEDSALSSSPQLVATTDRSSESVEGPYNSSVNFNSSTSLEQSATSSRAEQFFVAESSNTFSNVTSADNMNKFEEVEPLLLHAMVCRTSERCPKHCKKLKILVEHFASCKNERNCNICERARPLFRSIRVKHWKMCRQRTNSCGLCKLFNDKLGNLAPQEILHNNFTHGTIPSTSSSMVTDSYRTNSVEKEMRSAMLHTLQRNEAREDGLSTEKRMKMEESFENQNKQEEPKESEDDICKICMDAPLNTVFLECGHIVACVACAEKSRNCPICRQKIKRIVRTFKA